MEEKSKRYDKALDEAKAIHKAIRKDLRPVIEQIFPELIESEDERMRKEITDFIRRKFENSCSPTPSKTTLANWITWLEQQSEQKPVEDSPTLEEFKNAFITKAKQYDIDLPNRMWDIHALCKELHSLKHKPKQGEQKPYGQRKECEDCQFNYAGECKGSCILKRNEQKPFDYEHANIQQKDFASIGPKFKIGDWVIDKQGIVHQIVNVVDVTSNTYGYDVVGGGYFNDDVEGVRLWTIQDAERGNILFHSDTASNGVFIFKEIRDDGKVLCYCDYDSEDHFCTGEHHTCCWVTDKCIKPATKEQCDFLFAKMKEAGYRWDVDKKELIKL